MSTFGVWECPICREVYEETDGHECAVDALKGRVTELEAENAKLRKCVEAADRMRDKVTTLSTHDDKERVMLGIGYDAARAEVKP